MVQHGQQFLLVSHTNYYFVKMHILTNESDNIKRLYIINVLKNDNNSENVSCKNT